MLSIFAMAAVVAVVAVGVFFMLGPERNWSLFGSPDLGRSHSKL